LEVRGYLFATVQPGHLDLERNTHLASPLYIKKRRKEIEFFAAGWFALTTERRSFPALYLGHPENSGGFRWFFFEPSISFCGFLVLSSTPE
jgi:hypothetical protein